MAVANFFPKAVLAAASLLRRLDPEAFQRIVRRQVVGIAFDRSGAVSPEGSATLELLTDLIARLYPTISIISLEGSAELDVAERLVARARAINPDIEIRFDSSSVTVAVVVGEQPLALDVPTIYVGSDHWVTEISGTRPVGSGPSTNPFGAGASACFGAAGVFRAVFAQSLANALGGSDNALTVVSPEGGAFRLSLLDMARERRLDSAASDSARQSSLSSLPELIDIGETVLVGVGAVGNGAVWALGRTRELHGTLYLVDAESVQLSNLQRYVLTTQESVGRLKVDIAAQYFAAACHPRHDPELEQLPSLQVRPHAMHWGPFISSRGNYAVGRMLLALDSAEDRIAAQASLPRWVANAWTQPENLGVSRHQFLGDQACVACLYFPVGARKSKDVLYAEALRIQEDGLMEVRALLHSGAPVGSAFLKRAAERLNVPAEPLARFANEPLETFYSEALCGGIVLQLGGAIGTERDTEVPMAFQSALAGILLAAELVIDAGSLREAPLPCRTEVDLRRPLGTRLNSPAAKHPSGRCICQDPVYIRAYTAKYVT